MPIYVGGKKIKSIYVGTRKIARVYKGSTKIYNAAAAVENFPAVVGTPATSQETSGSSTHTILLPSGYQAGELILILYACRDNDTPTLPSGWDTIFNTANTARHIALSRYATGGEGSSSNYSGGSRRFAAHALRISGASGTPQASTPATGSSESPNPPATTPSGGSKKYLWFATNGHRNERTVSAYPTNYTNGATHGQSGSGVTCSYATRELEGTTADPGAFTMSGSEVWVAGAIAVSPS